MKIKHRLFLFDRKWQNHPLFGRIYPQPGFPRQISIGVLALLITGAGFLVYLHSQADAGWYNASWTYRKSITIDHTKVPSDQTSFPVLVSFTDSSLTTNTQASGNDILFTSNDGVTKLAHELETIPATNSGSLVAWVKIPTLSSTTDTVIYMYYGNSGTNNQQDPTNVWDSNYKAVYHMKTDPSTTCSGTKELCDSTGNANHGDRNGTASLTTGQIGNGYNFTGASLSDYFLVPRTASLEPSTNLTISAWVYFKGSGVSVSTVLEKGSEDTADSYGLHFHSSQQDKQIFEFNDTGGTSRAYEETTGNLVENTWQFVTVTYDDTNNLLKVYRNGVQQYSVAAAETLNTAYTTSNLYIGKQNKAGADGWFNGFQDEVHIEGTARDVNWILTEYNNQSSPSTFMTVGRVEQNTKAPVLVWKFDEGYGTAVNDASGNNQPGTITNATWVNKDICLFESSCLKFDGTDDFVTRPYVSDVPFGDAWCNDTNALHGCTASWSARLKLTFTGNVSSTNLTDFPVLVKIDSSRIDYGDTQNSGQDIRFVDASDPNTVLPHEVESWDENGSSYVWVKVPQIDASSTTDYIFMYYGNSGTPDGQQKLSTWNSSYKAVWHLKENPAITNCPTAKEVCDSTSNGIHGDMEGGMTSSNQVTGKINGALDFLGTDDATNHGDNANLDIGLADYTWGAWIKTSMTTWSMIMAKWSGVGDAMAWYLQINDQAANKADCGIHNSQGSGFQGYATSTTSINDDQWHYIQCVRDGDTLTIYVDGVQEDTLTNTGEIDMNITNADPFYLGREVSGDYYDGIIDEATVYSGLKSADWIKAEYLTGSDQLTTYEATDSTDGDILLDPGTDSFSVGAWFRHPTTLTGTDTLISRADNVDGVGYKIYYGSSGLCFGIDDTAGIFPSDDACSNTNYADNKWHYVQGVKSGTSSIKLYVDGKEADVDGNLAATGSLSATAPPFSVGMDANGTSNPWDGFIDEVKVYPYARSASEVKADFNAKGGILGVSTSLGGTDAKSSLSQGLVGYWKMDDGVGNACSSGVNKACDSSGNGLVGTWNNGAASTSGKFGFGTNYDGVNDYIDVNSPGLPTTDFTYSVWVKPDTVNDETVLMSGNVGGGNELALYIGACTSGSGYVCVSTNDTGGLETVTSTSQITAGTWWHLVFTRSGSSVNLYINGKLSASGTDAQALDFSTCKLFIGTDADSPCTGSLGNYFDGVIDDLRIYNRALSSREVTTLYDWAPGPVAYYKFEEKGGTSANDSSGLGNTGVLTNNPKWSSGKVGSALLFSGGSYVELTSTPIVDEVTNSSYTLSAWVYPNGTPPVGGGSGEFDYGILIKNGFHSGLRYTSGNDFYASIVNNSDTDFSTGTGSTYPPRQWYYVTQVVDTTAKTIDLYVNGVFKATETYTGTLKDYGSATFAIGRGEESSPCSENWEWCSESRIDDVKIYNYARTPKQIVQDMNGGHPAVGSPVGSALVHLKLDDGFGNVASNSGSLGSTGNAKLYNMASPGTYTSGWTNAGKYGKALTFDGADDSARVTSFTSSTAYSISTWIRPNSIGEGSAGRIVEHERNFWMYLFGGSPRLAFEIAGGTNGNWETPANSIRLKAWNHILVTYDSSSVSNTPVIYINGVRVHVAKTLTPVSITSPGTADLWIGNRPAQDRTFDGSMDEVKLYNYALNDNEAKVEYNNGKGIVLGSLSTNPDNRTASNSAARSYCPPGNAETNCAGTAGLDPAPIGEWKMDDHAGTTARDTSGNGYNGFLNNGPKWATGKVGSGLKFDGVNDFVRLYTPTILNNQGTDVTVEAWIKPERQASTDNMIFSVGDGTNNGYQLFIENGSDLLTGWVNNNPLFQFRGTDMTPYYGKWSHIVMTLDGTNGTLYLNGVKVGQAARTASNASIDAQIGAQCTAANSSPASCSQYFKGVIDDVRVYSYARSQAQVAWDYNKGQPQAVYRFDECTGNTIYNSARPPIATFSATQTYGIRVGTGGTNTSSGTCNSGSTGEAWANGRVGKFNSSLHFDGVDDRVIIPHNNFANFGTNPHTISTWINRDVTGVRHDFLNHKEIDGSPDYSYYVDTNNKLDLYFDGAELFGSTTLNANTWYNIVITRGTTGTWKAYINGKLEGTVADTDFPTVNYAWWIGSNHDNSGVPTTPFKGKIDDTMFFNYELSPAQIRVLYNQNAAVRFGPSSGRP